MDGVAGCFAGLRTFFQRTRKLGLPQKKRETKVALNHEYGDSRLTCNERIKHETSEQIPEPPPAYQGSAGGPVAYRPGVLETIKNAVVTIDADLRSLSLSIHDKPELGFHEDYAHTLLTEYMSSQGFEVTKHYAGLSTAWKAEWVHGKGGRVLGINSEMDALPGIGHACGHNLIAAGGVGVALAAKAAMEKHGINGSIVLLGTPVSEAEEGGAGKVILLERGAYDGMDICVISHPTSGPPNAANTSSTLALQDIEVEFLGHTAHAAAAPWEGINALDAAFLAYSSISVLRQQIKPTHRVHGIVEGRNWAPNVIPDYAKMRWYVRAPTYSEVAELRDRIKACFEAAALATSCRAEIKVGRPHYELKQNPALEQDFSNSVSQVDLKWAVVEPKASTDFGNVTYALPSLHPRYSIPTEPDGGNHTPEFTNSAATPEAHERMLEVVKALTLTSVRAIDDDDFFKEVRRTFEAQQVQARVVN